MEDNRPVHLYFGRDISTLKITPDVMEKILALPNRIVLCSSWSMLPESLKERPVSICFSHQELEFSSAVEIVNMVRTLSNLVDIKTDIPIAVSIDSTTPLDTVKMLQKSNIHGIIPEAHAFSWDEALKGMTALWAKIPYWPRHIMDQLPGSKKTPSKTDDIIKLTPRQQQIRTLIQERGASNKAIARVLGISESTVKLHITEIFKKYGVRNRTQLAVFSDP